MTNFKLLVTGLFSLIFGIISTPSLISNYFHVSKEWINLTHQGSTSNFLLIVKIRVALIAFGIILIIVGILFEKINKIILSIKASKNIIFDYSALKFVVLFFPFIIISNILIAIINSFAECDCALYFPISNFNYRIPNLENILVALSISIFFIISIKYTLEKKYNITHIIIIGIIIIIGTNLIQGYEHGFVDPITGSRSPITGKVEIFSEYYNDVINVSSSVNFISNYEWKQKYEFVSKSLTHPPGAVLSIYYLFKMSGNLAIVSILIAVISIILSTYFFYKILQTEFNDEISKYISLIFVLIPSIQIYYLAGIDALIGSFLLGFLYFYLKPRNYINTICSIFFLFLASFITYMFVFIIPIIILFEILKEKKIYKSVYIILGLIFIYVLLYVFLNYNYINSFVISSESQNREGYLPLLYPLSHIITRIESIFEVILFFTPPLTLLLIRGLKNTRKTKSNLLTLTWIAIISLLFMYAGGAMAAGETARNSTFIYPYLLFPIALYIKDFNINDTDKKILLYFVFMQTILMQLFGYYIW